MVTKKNYSIQCGKRLKQARLLAGLSRRALEERFNISANTIQAWEIARNPLSLKGAVKLASIFKDVGLYCTSDWLLTGEGVSPRLYNELSTSDASLTAEDISFYLAEEEAMGKEISCFQKVNYDAIVVNIIDDAMEPKYSIGDYVGGKRRYKEKIITAIGLDCIIQTVQNDLFLRRLVTATYINTMSDAYAISRNLNSQATLTAINPKTTVSYPVLYNQLVLWVAPVIWHRKKNEY